MPAFRGKIKEDQARGLVAHVRSLASSKGKPGHEKQQGLNSSSSFANEFQRLQEQFEQLQTEAQQSAKPARRGAASNKKKPAAGRELFLLHCAKCHGKNGTGQVSRKSTPEIPDLTDASWQARHSDAQLVKSMLEGKGKEMPAFQEKIDKEKAQSLLAVIRAFSPKVQPNKKEKVVPEQSKGKGFSPKQDPEEKENSPSKPKEPGSALNCIEKFLSWLGKFHPSAVNFPIALLTTAALAEFLKMITGRHFFDAPARYCIWIGAGAAVVAALLGWFLAGFSLTDDDWVKMTHRWLGTGAASCAIVLVMLSEISRRVAGGFPRICFRLALFGVAGLVMVTGYFGGALVFGLDHYAWPH